MLVRHIARARHATLSRGIVAIVDEDEEVVLLGVGVVREPGRGRSALRVIGARGGDRRVRDRAALDVSTPAAITSVSTTTAGKTAVVYSET